MSCHVGRWFLLPPRVPPRPTGALAVTWPARRLETAGVCLKPLATCLVILRPLGARLLLVACPCVRSRESSVVFILASIIWFAICSMLRTPPAYAPLHHRPRQASPSGSLAIRHVRHSAHWPAHISACGPGAHRHAVLPYVPHTVAAAHAPHAHCSSGSVAGTTVPPRPRPPHARVWRYLALRPARHTRRAAGLCRSVRRLGVGLVGLGCRRGSRLVACLLPNGP